MPETYNETGKLTLIKVILLRHGIKIPKFRMGRVAHRSGR